MAAGDDTGSSAQQDTSEGQTQAAVSTADPQDAPSAPPATAATATAATGKPTGTQALGVSTKPAVSAAPNPTPTAPALCAIPSSSGGPGPATAAALANMSPNDRVAAMLTLASCGLFGAGASGLAPALQGLVKQAAMGCAGGPGQQLRHFDLIEIMGDTSKGISVDQALVLQKAIRSLSDAQLASNLGALATLSPVQLQELLMKQGVNVKEVVGKLVRHIDPVKARVHFGPAFYFGPKPQPHGAASAGATAVSTAPMPHQLVSLPASQTAGVSNPAASGAAPKAGGDAATGSAVTAAALPAAAKFLTALIHQQKQKQVQQQILMCQKQLQLAGTQELAASGSAKPSADLLQPAKEKQQQRQLIGAQQQSTAGDGSEQGKQWEASQGPKESKESDAAGGNTGKRGSKAENKQEHPADEPIEVTMKRFPSGSVKRAIFEVLMRGGAQGFSVHDIWSSLQVRGFSGSWQDPRAAKSCIAASCAQEPAFCRSAPGMYAIRSIVIEQGGNPLPFAPPAPLGAMRTAAAAKAAANAKAAAAVAMAAKDHPARSSAAGSSHDPGGRRKTHVAAAVTGISGSAAAAVAAAEVPGAIPSLPSANGVLSPQVQQANMAAAVAAVAAQTTAAAAAAGQKGPQAEALQAAAARTLQVAQQAAAHALALHQQQQKQQQQQQQGPSSGVAGQLKNSSDQAVVPAAGGNTGKPQHMVEMDDRVCVADEGKLPPSLIDLKKDGSVIRNTLKCVQCYKTLNSSFSPLVLCDFCPRAHHLSCLWEEASSTPSPELYLPLDHSLWACPTCMERHTFGVPSKRRRGERDADTAATNAAAEEAVAEEGAAGEMEEEEEEEDMEEEEEARRAEEKEEREHRRAEERLERQALRARVNEERERMKEMARRAARQEVDDMEALEEEKLDQLRLEPLVEEFQRRAEDGQDPKGAEYAVLQELADTAVASGDPNAAILLAMAEAARDKKNTMAGRRPTASSKDLAKEAARKLDVVRLLIEGPQLFKVQLSGGSDAVACFMSAAAISQFSVQFSRQTGMTSLNTQQLLHAAAWPLDVKHAGKPLLEGVYLSLIRYLLLQWMGFGGSTLSRARRWRRIAVQGAWQEALRRYLLMSRISLPVDDKQLQDERLFDLSDDLVAVQAAVELGRVPYTMLSASFHLRLLMVLINDIASCAHMRMEIQRRLDVAADLTAHKCHAGAEARKRERDAERSKRTKRGADGAEGLYGSMEVSQPGEGNLLHGVENANSVLFPLLGTEGNWVLPPDMLNMPSASDLALPASDLALPAADLTIMPSMELSLMPSGELSFFSNHGEPADSKPTPSSKRKGGRGPGGYGRKRGHSRRGCTAQRMDMDPDEEDMDDCDEGMEDAAQEDADAAAMAADAQVDAWFKQDNDDVDDKEASLHEGNGREDHEKGSLKHSAHSMELATSENRKETGMLRDGTGGLKNRGQGPSSAAAAAAAAAMGICMPHETADADMGTELMVESLILKEGIKEEAENEGDASFEPTSQPTGNQVACEANMGRPEETKPRCHAEEGQPGSGPGLGGVLCDESGAREACQLVDMGSLFATPLMQGLTTAHSGSGVDLGMICGLGGSSAVNIHSPHEEGVLMKGALDDGVEDGPLETALVVRLEPIGMDRHYRRYWVLPQVHGKGEGSRSSGLMLHVEAADGCELFTLSSKDELDALLKRLNPRGCRELGLQAALQNCYAYLVLALEAPRYPQDISTIPRDLEQPEAHCGKAHDDGDVERMQEMADQQLLRSAASTLSRVGETLATCGVFSQQEQEEWEKRLGCVSDSQSLLSAVLACEAALCVLGDGLPEGADDESLEPMVAEAELYEAEFVLPATTKVQQSEQGDDDTGDGPEEEEELHVSQSGKGGSGHDLQNAPDGPRLSSRARGVDGVRKSGEWPGVGDDQGLEQQQENSRAANAPQPVNCGDDATLRSHVKRSVAASPRTSSTVVSARVTSIRQAGPATGMAPIEEGDKKPTEPSTALPVVPKLEADGQTSRLPPVNSQQAEELKPDWTTEILGDHDRAEDGLEDGVDGACVRKLVSALEEPDDSDVDLEENPMITALAWADDAQKHLETVIQAGGRVVRSERAAAAAATAATSAVSAATALTIALGSEPTGTDAVNSCPGDGGSKFASAGRKRIGLWRSTHERVVWLKDARRSKLTPCSATAAFAAVSLADRCSSMLHKLVSHHELTLESERRKANGLTSVVEEVEAAVRRAEDAARRAAAIAASDALPASESVPRPLCTKKRTDRRERLTLTPITRLEALLARTCIACERDGGEMQRCANLDCAANVHLECQRRINSLAGMSRQQSEAVLQAWRCSRCSAKGAGSGRWGRGSRGQHQDPGLDALPPDEEEDDETEDDETEDDDDLVNYLRADQYVRSTRRRR